MKPEIRKKIVKKLFTEEMNRLNQSGINIDRATTLFLMERAMQEMEICSLKEQVTKLKGKL